MAEISKSVQTVYTLTLTEDEAKTLRDLLASVGGSSTHTRRGYAQQISNALYEAGIEAKKIDELGWDTHGHIEFLTPEVAEGLTWYTARERFGIPHPTRPYDS